jgi:hypothetical protein
MSEHMFTMSFINGNPGFVINVDTPEELDQAIANCLPIFKKFKTAVDTYREKQIIAATNPPGAIPDCPIHHVPMSWKTGVSRKTGKSYAFWSCAVKNPDGSFCPGKV